jgi:hypothetical protein
MSDFEDRLADDVMDFIWQCTSTGADIRKMLAKVITRFRKDQKALNDDVYNLEQDDE